MEGKKKSFFEGRGGKSSWRPPQWLKEIRNHGNALCESDRLKHSAQQHTDNEVYARNGSTSVDLIIFRMEEYRRSMKAYKQDKV